MGSPQWEGHVMTGRAGQNLSLPIGVGVRKGCKGGSKVEGRQI